MATIAIPSLLALIAGSCHVNVPLVNRNRPIRKSSRTFPPITGRYSCRFQSVSHRIVFKRFLHDIGSKKTQPRTAEKVLDPTSGFSCVGAYCTPMRYQRTEKLNANSHISKTEFMLSLFLISLPSFAKSVKSIFSKENIFTTLRFFAVIVSISSMFVHLSQVEARSEIIDQTESQYNNIFIHKEGSNVIMRFSHNKRFYTESSYDLKDTSALPVLYTRFSTMATAYPMAVSKVLVIGLGGGRTASYIHRFMPDVSVTAVELDQAVFEMAKKHFGVIEDDRLKVVVEDGRRFLMKTDEKYDVIIVDAYRGPFVPFHLLTKEFFELAASRLAKGGVLAQNIEPTTMLFDAAAVTMSSVFPNIDFYEAGGNIVAIGYGGPSVSNDEIRSRFQLHQSKYSPRYNVLDLQSRRIYPQVLQAAVLTDNFAPVESLKGIEVNNRKMAD
ncbi:spermidine synthase [Agrobacterium tumefaciens]|uniref:spermidine synthase n=1 Tax=Agrobacterium tumefaciens TaxID=358 RepID=UPI00138E1E35|nr:fused MFS/spermidine synthase [Agrobacterium tumefaciens]